MYINLNQRIVKILFAFCATMLSVTAAYEAVAAPLAGGGTLLM